MSNRFQFTHPVWGATQQVVKIGQQAEVSIHAPRVGCDRSQLAQNQFSPAFQFTHPVWGATLDSQLRLLADGVSIHAPRVGCDLDSQLRLLADGVSIHAPRVGCDPPTAGDTQLRRGFNSRTPCGVRRRRFAELDEASRFNSRTPCGVRQDEAFGYVPRYDVSIHAPRVGCDCAPKTLVVLSCVFQFTHPVWGATCG